MTESSLGPIVDYLTSQARQIVGLADPAADPKGIAVVVERRNRKTRDSWSRAKALADDAAVLAGTGGNVTEVALATEALVDLDAVRAALRHEIGHYLANDPTQKRDRCTEGDVPKRITAAIEAVASVEGEIDWSGYAETLSLFPVLIEDDEPNPDDPTGGSAKPNGKWYSLNKVECGYGHWARVSSAKQNTVLCGETGCSAYGQPMLPSGRPAPKGTPTP